MSIYSCKTTLWCQSDADEVEDALAFINPDQTITVNIKPAVDTSVKSLQEAGFN